MRFEDYLRWEGWVAVIAGTAMYVFGLFEGHQGPVDAAIGGVMMVGGTSVFMVVRHGVPFRAAGTWFTSAPVASASSASIACRRGVLVTQLLGETFAMVVAAVGLSYLTGFWLTYMDCGVWAVAIGAIKLGPARSTIAEQEARRGASYLVARRRTRGTVELAERR